MKSCRKYRKNKTTFPNDKNTRYKHHVFALQIHNLTNKRKKNHLIEKYEGKKRKKEEYIFKTKFKNYIFEHLIL